MSRARESPWVHTTVASPLSPFIYQRPGHWMDPNHSPFRILVRLFRRVVYRLRGMRMNLAQRRLRTNSEINEAERLDRLRNPSNYRGR
jgi:hypothetical protein